MNGWIDGSEKNDDNDDDDDNDNDNNYDDAFINYN